MKAYLIPAKLDKISGAEKNKFADSEHYSLMQLGGGIVSCITARYYKGISAHGDNVVIVVHSND